MMLRNNPADKLIFFYRAFDRQELIEAQPYNPIFQAYDQTFYGNRKYRTYEALMRNFKKYMKLAAENRGHSVVVVPMYGDILLHGIRNMWMIKYNES